MPRFFRLLVFMLLSAGTVMWGTTVAAADLSQVTAALEKGYGLLTDLQADFSQRTMIASLKREERGAGEVFIKKGASGNAMFRFNYTKPRQQIVSNGKSVWYYLPENKQVMVGDVASMFSGGNGVALNYLTGMGHVTSDFTISFVGDGRDRKGNYVLELIPKKSSQMLEKLHLTVSAAAVDRYLADGVPKDPFPLLTSVVFDSMGNRTSIDFSRVKTNQGLGSERFTFKVPAGVEVIKNK